MFKDTKNIIILVLLLLLFLIGGISYYRTNNLQSNLNNKENLLSYLQDTMKVYKNDLKQLTYEKSVLKTDFETLKENRDILSDNQNKLISQIERLEKENKTLISAFRVKMKVLIDSIENFNPITIDDTTILFKDSTHNLKYDIIVTGIKPINPSLKMKSLQLFNEQEIDFFWGSKKEGYPEKFSITNTNPYFKIYDIDGFTIPELNKEEIKPTNFQKVKNFLTKDYKGFMIGVGLGGATVYILEKF